MTYFELLRLIDIAVDRLSTLADRDERWPALCCMLAECNHLAGEVEKALGPGVLPFKRYPYLLQRPATLKAGCRKAWLQSVYDALLQLKKVVAKEAATELQFRKER